MTLATGLLVALGGALGAPLRLVAAHHLDGLRWWPFGTLLVNVLGSFLLGWLVAAGLGGHDIALLGIGFCGALTTYSSFSVQTADLPRWRALAYSVATIGGSVGACMLGFALG